jgi:DMSO/TMAO reductase YedYZ molybdopterin-dependent catalytic subunit
MPEDLTNEAAYDWLREQQRTDHLIRHGDGNDAEMRWASMRGLGHYTPADRFFVRSHTGIPQIDVRTWALSLHGSGLRRPVEFGYEDLLGMPAESMTAFIECTGNGRSYYTTQQNQRVEGTPWGLGAIGVARWRGVRFSTLLERAGMSDRAVDIMPRGLDRPYQNHGRVRRPIPVAKALKDVLLAYEMNGETLTPEHGYPMRVVVPDWVGIASIKWVGDIEVSEQPLHSPWDTDFYRLFGLGHPPEGSAPLTVMPAKSAFELPHDARLTVGCDHVLTGRSWSGRGAIRRVQVSTDGGTTWQDAQIKGPRLRHTWTEWECPWRPATRGPHTLMAKATDETGVTQSLGAAYNTKGYLFGAVVRHPVKVV